MSARSVLRLAAQTPSARRTAVERGELRSVWPGAAWDIVTLIWWRSWYATVRRVRGPGPDERWHSPTGGCPMCNPGGGGR